jgi:hypothetical protein
MDYRFVLLVCSNPFISGNVNYTHHKVFGFLTVHSIYGLCFDSTLFIVLWDIAHATLLQFLVYKEPTCDRGEAKPIP